MGVLNKSSMFAYGVQYLGNGSVDFDTDTIKCALMKQSFVGTSFNETARDTWDFFNDIPDADIAKNSFKAIGTNDITISAADDNVYYGAGTVSVTFPTVTNNTSCGGIVVFKSQAQETTSELICFCKFASAVTADGGTFTATLNANGLFYASFD